MEHQPRILILRGGAIGDFIITLPALQAVRDQWPEATIELLGYPHIARLAMLGGIANKVRSLDEAGIARFFVPKTSFEEAQIDYIRSFDLVISYLHDPGDIVRDNLLYAGAKQVVSSSPVVKGMHAVDVMLKPLEALAIYSENRTPSLRLGEDAMQKGRKWLQNKGLERSVMAIHPGSGSPRKNWAPGNFIHLARACRDKGLNCFYILGEADALAREAIERNASDFPVLKDCSLEEVAGIIAAADSYVGNDSGITHLAAALGLRVTAIYGPSDIVPWGVRGHAASILEAPDKDLNRLTVDAVVNALNSQGNSSLDAD